MPFFMYPLYYTNFLYPKSISYLEYYMNKIPHRYFPQHTNKGQPYEEGKKNSITRKIAVICHHKNCSYKWPIDNCFFIFHVGYVLLHKKGIHSRVQIEIFLFIE